MGAHRSGHEKPFEWRKPTMAQLPHSTPGLIPPPGEKEDEPGSGFTRRGVLAGAAAATAAVSIGAAETPASAQADDDMVTFVQLSAALTGIAATKLATGNFNAPVPNSDPVDIKRVYFDRVSKRPAFRRLLQITRDARQAEAIIEQVKATPETKYLARSIVLMWYLGAWYDPGDLQKAAELPNHPQPAFKVISSKAYTQAWALRVAQAHPMGFSEMQFGYWARQPSDRSAFTGN
jgi:D-sorbitol dehydrogenase-like protein